MNAGRGTERLIAEWLAEEAPPRAPDRILDEADLRIDRTTQRRFAAMWREPMIISTWRLLAAAAVILVAVFGAGWIGRSTAPAAASVPSTPPPSPTADPTPSPSPAVTLSTFRAARNAICEPADLAARPLKDHLAGVYDPNLTTAQRNAKIDILQQLVDQGTALRAQLGALEVPPEIAADQTAALTRGEDIEAILKQEIALLRAGKLSEAQQWDLTTDPINRLAEDFEQKYNLSPCP